MMSHHIFELLRGAVVHYGYWGVAALLLLEGAGLPLPGETILLLASFLAYTQHELRLPWVIAVGIVATTAGGELGFALGRHGGRPLIERYRHVFSIRAETMERGDRLFERYGAATAPFARGFPRHPHSIVAPRQNSPVDELTLKVLASAVPKSLARTSFRKGTISVLSLP